MHTFRLIPKILLRIIVWILPLNLLDGCLNRDPYLKIDDRFCIFAICGSCPQSLILRDRSAKWDWNVSGNDSVEGFDDFLATTNWTLENVTHYKLSDAVIIGDSSEGSFIADRKTGRLRLYPSLAKRDVVLRQEYGLDPDKDIHPPSEWLWTKSRFLWPWFLSYYIGCLLVLPLYTVLSARKRILVSV
jgi:hypothetical protein